MGCRYQPMRNLWAPGSDLTDTLTERARRPCHGNHSSGSRPGPELPRPPLSWGSPQPRIVYNGRKVARSCWPQKTSQFRIHEATRRPPLARTAWPCLSSRWLFPWPDVSTHTPPPHLYCLTGSIAQNVLGLCLPSRSFHGNQHLGVTPDINAIDFHWGWGEEAGGDLGKSETREEDHGRCGHLQLFLKTLPRLSIFPPIHSQISMYLPRSPRLDS